MTSFSKALFKTNTHTCEQHKHDGLLTQQISPQSCPVCSSYFNNLWVCVCVTERVLGEPAAALLSASGKGKGDFTAAKHCTFMDVYLKGLELLINK